MTETLGDKSRMSERRRIWETDHQHHLPYIPHDLVVENILTRLRVVNLIRFSGICKLWYNSIFRDPHFASSHTLMQSQSYPRLIFYFINIPCYEDLKITPFFYLSHNEVSYDDVDNGNDDGEDSLFLHEFTSIEGKSKREIVGWCNGLICFIGENKDTPGVFLIHNPSRVTLLSIFRPSKDGDIICYGFGLDSLTKEYKVVLIFRTVEDEYECLVFTLGTNSWRETRIPPPSSRQIFSTKPYFKSAIFCGGALFWRTSSDELGNEKMLLLSFDLHDETFQVIHVPNECVSVTMTMNQQQELVHLLEFKGYPCVVRLEKLTESSSSNDHVNPINSSNNNSHSSSNCSSCKVHLHLLKLDKVKQVWIKETFDLLPSLSLPCFNDTTTSTITPRVRVVSFSGRVLLYWFDSKERGLQLYDLQRKHLKMVRPSLEDRDNFKEELRMDYQLNCHIENFLPLETLVPDGARKVDADAFDHLIKEKKITSGGYCFVPREPKVVYHFN